MAKATFPDGIDPHHRQWKRILGPLSRFLILATIIGVGLAGLLGGGAPVERRAASADADLTVVAPQRLRNGNMFELRFVIAAHRPLADAVVAVPEAMLKDVTVNSLTPEPEEEKVAGETYLFHLGAMAAGTRRTFKIDGQLNPPLYGRLRGDYRLFDGERELARLPASLLVIP